MNKVGSEVWLLATNKYRIFSCRKISPVVVWLSFQVLPWLLCSVGTERTSVCYVYIAHILTICKRKFWQICLASSPFNWIEEKSVLVFICRNKKQLRKSVCSCMLLPFSEICHVHKDSSDLDNIRHHFNAKMGILGQCRHSYVGCTFVVVFPESVCLLLH